MRERIVVSEKTVKESFTVMTEMILLSHVNGAGLLFGGQLMAWMDIAGGICAKRHSNSDVVTACVDKLEFFHPAKPNDVVVIKAQIFSVGNTSMKVGVSAEVEKDGMRSERIKTCSAVFTFVAVDGYGGKNVVPKIKVENDYIDDMTK